MSENEFSLAKQQAERMWFVSDTHFGHKRIIELSNRPFASIDEHDEGLIERWNARVGKNDVVYHLGDFALCPPARARTIRKLLNGRIRLIKGNHDPKNIHNIMDCFEWVKDYHEITIRDPRREGGKNTIVLSHYAFRTWNKQGYGTWSLYGHSHGHLPDDPTMLSFDVGVDCHGYAPISLDEVDAIMAKKTFELAPDYTRIERKSITE